MTTYVLGAGASYPIYPLASKLLQHISDYITGCGKCFNRFDYADWPKVMAWLAENPNPLLRQAFQNGNIEQIFTVLDLADSLHDDSLMDILRASKKGADAVAAAEASHKKLADEFLAARYGLECLLSHRCQQIEGTGSASMEASG